MKYRNVIVMILTLLVAANTARAQRVVSYFVLDNSNTKKIKFNHIKGSDGTYELELFNVFFTADTTHFVLFSALPNLATKKPQWKEINVDTIKNKLISADSLNEQFNRNLVSYINSNGRGPSGNGFKSELIKPIIKINGKWLTLSTPTLMEHFQITKITSSLNYMNNIFPNLNQFFEINTDAAIFPLTKFEEIYKEKFNHPSFNSHYDAYDGFNIHYVYNQPIIIRDNNTQIEGKLAYSYWTLASWSIDGKNQERGVDRFNYIPGIGIVSGAFSYYFWYDGKGKINTPPASTLVNNYLNNVQMMPYEINSKPFKSYQP